MQSCKMQMLINRLLWVLWKGFFFNFSCADKRLRMSAWCFCVWQWGEGGVLFHICQLCKCSFCRWLCPPASLPEGPFEARPSWCPGRPLSCMAWRRSAPWTSPGRQRGPPSLSGWSSRAGWFEADGRRWSKQISYHIDYLAAAQLVVQKKFNHL